MSLERHVLVEDEHLVPLLLVLTSENSALGPSPMVGNLHVVPVLREGSLIQLQPNG